MKPNMVLYAKRGDIELYVPEGEDPNAIETQGVILDVDSKDETPVGIQQALKWGYWIAAVVMPDKVVYKQEPGTVESRLTARRDAFTEMSNKLAESLRGGRITLGMWEEEMRTRMRMYLYGCAALTKGGPQNMTRSDIGKIGAHLKKQYKWLHGFSQDIYDKRDTITAKAIAARSRLYAAAGNVVATEAQAGYFAPNTRRDPPIILPWLPGDGSTRCLNQCGCVWELEVLSENKSMGVKTVQAAWHMRPELEHCDDCVPRDDHVETVEVPIGVDVPWQIGLGGV